MYALLITVFISLVLVVFFLAMFLREGVSGQVRSSSERDALLPLEEDLEEKKEQFELSKKPGTR